MALVFGKQEKVNVAKSVVEQVFARDVVVLDESAEEVKTPTGQLAVVKNFRGFTTKHPGRKNANVGQTMVSLAALEMVPVSDLASLAENLLKLAQELKDAQLG